jgi:colicin import membrane protein
MSATTYYEPNKVPAGILALLVHLLFFAFLYFGFNWNRQFYAPATMTVSLWASLPSEAPAASVSAPVKRPAPPAPAPRPPEQHKMTKPEIVIPEKKAMAKPVETKPVETKPVETSQDRNMRLHRAIEEARMQAEAEIAARQKQEAQSIADQQAARQRAADQVRQEQQAAAVGKVLDEYVAKIQEKIRGNVVMPPAVPDNVQAVFAVTLLPGGSVLKADLEKSSGNVAYDNAVQRAILKSDPLPIPQDPQLFNHFRELHLRFEPGKDY